eukprot:TRINITY_DN766_c0_g1_i1.p2 TRINITY_DN766_c0_g1~~TRINITY_DN766_c0_g1_i1.p2  ORF type:complete len:285 (-),score=125.24 TRINITY_DN766_c0_g1_i1:1235-2089(-)
MCDLRDTIILPCRHLCLCNACADSLRYQANNCPICRSPFRALLQIRALQKVSASHPALASGTPEEGVPPGYVSISLVEALNGPILSSPPQTAATPAHLLGSKSKNKRKKTKKTPPLPSSNEDREEEEEEEEPHEMIPLQAPKSSIQIINETSPPALRTEERVDNEKEEHSSPNVVSLSQEDLVEEELAKMDEKPDDEEAAESRGPSPTPSIHSSQESASSTKRLLADNSHTVTPESRVKVVNVLPQDDDDEEEDEHIDHHGEEEEESESDIETGSKQEEDKLYL